jgi:hypothetical protein
MTNAREARTQQTQEFIKSLELACTTEEEWLILIQFGIDALARDQAFLITLIVDRAMRKAQSDFAIHVGAEVSRLMALLSLRVMPVRG